jgi:hypothetical protein
MILAGAPYLADTHVLEEDLCHQLGGEAKDVHTTCHNKHKFPFSCIKTSVYIHPAKTALNNGTLDW